RAGARDGSDHPVFSLPVASSAVRYPPQYKRNLGVSSAPSAAPFAEGDSRRPSTPWGGSAKPRGEAPLEKGIIVTQEPRSDLETLPILPLRNSVVFPASVVPI